MVHLDRAQLRQILAEERALERARRRTVEMARVRHEAMGARYRPGRFHHALGAVCDAFVASCLAQRGLWTFVNAPPRHGKTDLIGRAMPVRAMLADPSFVWLYGTSTTDRAEEVSLKMRRMVEWLHRERGVAHMAPGEKWTKTEWYTAGGGGWVGVGVGTATGGIGAHGLILDDTTGSAARARSPAFRREQREWTEEDMLSRLMHGGGLFHMETRRGLEDSHAYLTREYGQRIDEFVWPLIAEQCDLDAARPYEWREVGGYLWPAEDGHVNYGAEWHALHPEIRGRLREKLYQQRPLPGEDTMWDAGWLSYAFIGWPHEQWAACHTRVLTVDGAATDGKGDHTVIGHYGFTGAKAMKLGQRRGQWGYPVLEAELEAAIEATRPRPGSPPCRYEVLIEDTSNTRAARQALQRKYPFIHPINVSGQGSKQDRWRSTLGLWSNGGVLTPEARYGLGLGTPEDAQGGGESWVPGWRVRMLRLEDKPGDQIDDEADADTIALRWWAHPVEPEAPDYDAALTALGGM